MPQTSVQLWRIKCNLDHSCSSTVSPEITLMLSTTECNKLIFNGVLWNIATGCVYGTKYDHGRLKNRPTSKFNHIWSKKTNTIEISPNSTWLITSRHDTLYSPCILAGEKSWRNVTRHVALVGQNDATRSSRQARLARHVFRGVANHSVEWDRHVHLTFSRSCSWDWCKCKAHKLVQSSNTAYSSSAMLEQARLDMHTRHNARVSWYDVTSGIWAIGVNIRSRTKARTNCCVLELNKTMWKGQL